jgi:hypothetical protein
MLAVFGKKISTRLRERKLGNDVELLQFEPESEDLFAKRGDVVLVRFADLADQAVNPQTLQKPGHLAGGFAEKVATKILTLEPADVELAAEERLK